MSLRAFIEVAMMTFAIGAFAGDAAGNGGGGSLARVGRWLDCTNLPQVESKLRDFGLPVAAEYDPFDRVFRAQVRCSSRASGRIPASLAIDFTGALEVELGAENISRPGKCYVDVTFGLDFFNK